MPKQLNVSLTFQADTSQAKQQIKDLQNALQQLIQSTSKSSEKFSLTKDFQEAKSAAIELKSILESSTNSEGLLNLKSFNSNLQKSGKDLNAYASQLNALGPEGQQAFLKISRAILQADVPLKKSNTLLNQFATTLANTARWQLSSSVLHGFMGAIQTAYGYAQDLNKSLNNIRIVTGYSTDEMANFAIEANKAAKALSTTTTNYTDAALIYYQQGIRDQSEISARTETTIKLANVSRQSAEEVSQQMTAIWNNFDDGSKSLEYYADAITALGANTASSSEEIATGLEKFAAVSKTVGLSYEYATAALATITAQTRQSADTVGTGLRTLFARLESLKLGESLEDGVDLNKYSKALHDVGVEVLDTSGQMRDMDNILDDLATRWSALGQAQKMALAQTVGGVRQYTNLIALMDNWDKMQQNILTAKNSSGTLQEQAEIYAESWEAAQKRVKAAAESIYNALIDENFFIGFANSFTKILTVLKNTIDGLGGLPGVVSMLGSVLLNAFGDRLATSIDNTISKFNRVEQVVDSVRTTTVKAMSNLSGDDTVIGGLQTDVIQKEYSAQEQLLNKIREIATEKKTISETTQNNILAELENLDAIGKQVLAIGELRQAQEDLGDEIQANIELEVRAQSDNGLSDLSENLIKSGKASIQVYSSLNKMVSESTTQVVKSIRTDHDKAAVLEQVKNKFANFEEYAAQAGIELDKLNDNDLAELQAALNKVGQSKDLDSLRDNLISLQDTVNTIGDKAKENFSKLADSLYNDGMSKEKAQQFVQELEKAYIKSGTLLPEQIQRLKEMGYEYDAISGKIQKIQGEQATFGQGIAALGSTLSSLAMTINSIKGLSNIWSDEDKTTGEKILATMTTMGMLIPNLTRLLNMENLAKLKGLVLDKQRIASIFGVAVAKGTETAANVTGTVAAGMYLVTINNETTAYSSLTAAIWAKIAAQMASLGPALAIIAVIGALVAIITLATKAYNADAEAAKKAAEAAKHVGEEADKVKQKAQELHDAFDSYDSLVEKLENCTKGTKEWHEALDEVNSKVLEIMQNHPELIGQMDVVREDGRLILKNYEEILGQMDTAAERLQAAAIGANAHASEAQLKSDSTNLYRKFYKYEGDAGNGYVDQQAIKANRAVDSIIKNINNYSEALKLGKDSFKESLGDMYSTLNMSDTEFNEFYKSLTELSTKSYQVAVQLDEAAKVAAQVALGDKYSGLGSNVNNAIITETGEEYQEIYDEIYKGVKSLSQKLARGGDEGRQEAAEIWSRYLKAIGENEATSKYKRSDNFIQGNKQNRTYHFIDSKGDEQSLTEKEIADIIAASEAIGELGDKAEELASNFTKMSGEGREFAASVINSKNAFDEYAAQDALQNMTSSRVAEIASTEDYEGRKNIWEMIGMNEEEFESFAKTLGMTTFELIQFLQKAADDVLDTYINLSEDLSSTPKKYFDATRHHFSELVIAEQKEIVAGYKKVFDAGGEEAVGYFDQMINEATGHEAEMAQILSRMDFSDWDIDKNLKEALQEAGLELPKNFDELVDGLRRATNATKNLDLQNFRTQFGDIQKIVQSLDEWGKTISAEDYEKLGKGYEDYFTLMADGTYKLTGNAKDFYELVQKNQSTELLGKISAVSSNIINGQNSLAIADAAKNSGFDITKTAIDESGEASTAHYNAQLNYLEALGYSKSEIEKWRENTIPTLDVLDKVAKAVRQTSGQYEALSEQIQTNEANQRENIQAYYSMATSLEDLKGRQQDLLDLGIEVNEYEKDFINQKHILGVEQLQTAESLQEVAEIQNKYGLTVDQVKSKVFDLTTSLNLLNEAYEHGYITLEEYENKIKEWIEAAVQNASTLEELNVAVGQFLGVENFDETNNLHYDEYAQGLINLGSKYESCKEAVADYQDALSALNGATGESYEAIKKEIQATEEHLEMSIRAEEACKKYGLTVDTLTAQMKEIAREEGVSEKTALEMAIANERMNRGVAELVNNWEDWKKILKESDKTAEDYAATLDDLSAAVTELVGWYEDLQLDSEFVEQNMNLIDKAAQGDVTAILELGAAVAQLEIASSDLDATLAAGRLADGSENAFQQWANDALTAQQNFENLQNSLGGMFSTIQENMAALQEGASLQDVLGGPGGLDAFIEQLNAYAAATGMTATEMQEMLASVGVTANVQRDFQEQEVTVPAYREEVTAINYRRLPVTHIDSNTGQEMSGWDVVPEYTKASVPVEPLKTKGFVEVASISMDKNGEAPHIQPPQFVGKRAPSKTAIGGGTGNKPGSKGSGSTSKTTKKETKDHKNLTDEKERYHIINQQIERQSNLLDRLSKSKERAFGPQKQKWYTQELKSLKDMGKMYEEHLRQSSAYLAQDKATMQAWGAQISAKDGSILNYDALLKAQVDAYNRAVDKYNASSQTDADKDALKAAEDRFKKFQDDLKQYEDTVKTHEEDINKYIDNMIEQYDTMQAKTADAIEFRIEYDDSVLDFLDKLIDRLDSWNGSMFAAVDIMGKLNDKTGALIQKNKDLETATAETLEHFLMDYKEFDAQGNIIYQTGMSKADSDAFINRFNTGGLTSKDIEMLAHMPEEERQLLMDYAEQRQDNTDALIETAQAVVDDVERQFNDAKDELAEAAKPIASATAALDNYAAIIDIVGADYLGVTDDIMQRFRDQQWNVLHETTMSNKAIMESLAAQRDMIEQEMNNALANGNDELAEMYREKLKGINDEVQSATEEWYSSWQAELSKLEEDFEKHIDEIKTKALDLAAGDAGTWQSLKDTMDYAQEAAERFLPEYKEIYEFSKLNRDINKSIDDTDNIKNKQALKKLQDEINKLQEKSGQISQYDLDNARRRYELELARLALEESRNAKEVVRLSKDSEGNWSYIYTASEEDVANAEQNYEDKLFAMQQANADYINGLQGQLTQATEDYYNKVAEINLIYKDDDEKRREELEKARMQYEETMQYYGGELQKAMDNNKQLYDEDWAWYSDYTQKINDDQGYRLGELENYVTEFDNTMLGMATGYDSVAAFEDDLLDHSIDTLGQMDEAYEHWSEQIHFSMEEAGTSVEDFAEDMMEQVDHTIVPKAEEARDSVEDLGETVVDIMGEMVDAAEQWRQTYSAAMDSIIAKNDAVKQSIQQVISALSALKTAQIGHDTTTGRAPEGAGQAGPTTFSPTKTSTTPSTGTSSTPGAGTSGSTTPTTKTTKTPPHVVETGYRYQNDETCMGYTKYSDGTETHNAGGHDKKFDHYEDNDAKYICTKCKHMWTVKNARKVGGGCFAAGTKIMLPTRELKNIEEIQLGEEILAYNIETESFENKVVNMIYFKRGYNKMADIELSNGNILTMTLGHPLLTTQGWKSLDLENSNFEHGVQNATLLSVGDILIGYDRPIIVNNINIYSVDKDYTVYCLGVDGYHNFIANDIIVHNALYAQITKFATGGYTGDFGNPNEGKLAVLHNKELVLNKDDTEHILNAVDMVRSISKTIDAYAMTNQFTIGNLTAARGVNPINGQMEQSVTITAEFPNATDRNEIAEAFNTLINQASQYANRKY